MRSQINKWTYASFVYTFIAQIFDQYILYSPFSRLHGIGSGYVEMKHFETWKHDFYLSFRN